MDAVSWVCELLPVICWNVVSVRKYDCGEFVSTAVLSLLKIIFHSIPRQPLALTIILPALSSTMSPDP